MSLEPEALIENTPIENSETFEPSDLNSSEEPRAQENKEYGDGESYKNLDDGLNFSNKATEYMEEPARKVPMQTLQDVIKQGNAFSDPRGSDAKMYYSQMYINDKMYNIEVLYDETNNTVYHFKYARETMGNLPAIKK